MNTLLGFGKLLETLGIGKGVAVEESEHDDHSGHNHRRKREVDEKDSKISEVDFYINFDIIK